jgi:cell wall-associated NlpC family hydrolase
MSVTKNLFFSLIFLFTLNYGYSQIITSKKEAVKKGLYKKSAVASDSKKTNTTVDKSSKKADKIVDVKNVKNAKPTPPDLKNVICSVNADDIEITAPENYVAVQMINNAMQFLGVRYRGGGTSPAGMDCSGMVTAVYNLFDMSIPRSSRDMATVGEKIDSASVKKGDLIFFKTNGRRVINHVGMVVEIIGDEIKFIHSSTSQGVIISSTKESYYKKTFAQINRVLSNL